MRPWSRNGRATADRENRTLGRTTWKSITSLNKHLVVHTRIAFPGGCRELWGRCKGRRRVSYSIQCSSLHPAGHLSPTDRTTKFVANHHTRVSTTLAASEKNRKNTKKTKTRKEFLLWSRFCCVVGINTVLTKNVLLRDMLSQTYWIPNIQGGAIKSTQFLSQKRLILFLNTNLLSSPLALIYFS